MIAGLWDQGKDIETVGPLKSCPGIITGANDFVSEVKIASRNPGASRLRCVAIRRRRVRTAHTGTDRLACAQAYVKRANSSRTSDEDTR
jgi:hypothetical protein